MSQATQWSHQATFAAQTETVASARKFVAIHLTANDLGYLIADVELAVSELATNATLHGVGPYTVTLRSGVEAVVLSVTDRSDVTPALAPVQVYDTSGRGLSIVNALARDWGIDPGPAPGKSVWATFPTHLTSPNALRRGGLRGVMGKPHPRP